MAGAGTHNIGQSNKILDAVTLFVEQDTQYRVINPISNHKDNHSHLLKMQAFQAIAFKYRDTKQKEELKTLAFVKNEIRKMKMLAAPTVSNYLLLGALARFLINLWTGSKESIRLHQNYLEKYQKDIAEKQNFQQLNDSLKKNGFHQNIDDILLRSIQQELPKFSIRYYDVKSPEVNFILHFEKIPGTSSYQFNNFETSNKISGFESQSIIQWHQFSLNNELSFNAKEAALLTIGKSICKEEDDWYYLTPKGLASCKFNVEEKLRELPLSNLSQFAFKSLVSSIKSGVSKELPLRIEDRTEKFYLEAAPSNNQLVIKDKYNNFVDWHWLKECVQNGNKYAKDLNQAAHNQTVKASNAPRIVS